MKDDILQSLGIGGILAPGTAIEILGAKIREGYSVAIRQQLIAYLQKGIEAEVQKRLRRGVRVP